MRTEAHNAWFTHRLCGLYPPLTTIPEFMMETRRRKLTFRAWRRGFREMDLYMGSFADKYLPGFDESQLDEFERILSVPDWEVYAWLIESPAP